jgi:hypothetical protein
VRAGRTAGVGNCRTECVIMCCFVIE